MKLKQVNFKDWIKDLSKNKNIEMSEEMKKELKSFYDKNSERNSVVATMLAASILSSKIDRKLIVVGWNITRYDKEYLVCLDMDSGNIISVGGNILKDILPMDIISVTGHETSGKLIANNLKKLKDKKAKYEDIEKFVKSDDCFFNVKSGDKFIFKHISGKVAIFKPIDWSDYDRDNPKPISEVAKKEIIDGNKVSFTMSCFYDNIIVNIYFRDIPIEYFSGVLLKDDFNSIEQIQSVLELIPVVIPVYISKDPIDVARPDGKISTTIRAVGFGILSTPFDVNKMLVEGTDKKVNNLHNEEFRNIKQKTVEILKKYEKITVESLKQLVCNEIDAPIFDDVFEDIIKDICKTNIGIMIDPETIGFIGNDDVNKTNKNEDDYEDDSIFW